ncbi:DUF262 domain-containing HNH endonuclease family protein [Nonomuraea angiospora]|uniref:DUF262 domain-containing protein n=1 Tax=Nonomuraea angiospora TaxID=46172 RepID=UPI003426695A
MVRSKIQALEQPIGDIFSDRYRFTIPRYQRPYAWTTEQAGEMIDDLLAASDAKPSLDDADPYFLGSIVLVKDDDDAQAEVVDGQQRLTTLTILLSTLRGYVPDAFISPLHERIFQKGDPIKGTLDQPRLTVRDRDQEFFHKHIQKLSTAQDLKALATDSLPDSRRNVVQNASLFHERLSSLSESARTRLVQFVDRHTYLVVVATQDFESAYRIFTVLNERGLNLSHSDILKSEIIGKIPDSDQNSYTHKWESEEEDLGRSDFADLFSHIRMVFAKTKARESILREFRTAVLAQMGDGREFIDSVLVPMSDAFEVVKRADYKAATGAEEINQLLRWLNLLDNDDWIPPAIRYLSNPTTETHNLRRFLIDLERLASSLLVRRVDVTRRIERYGRVLQALEAGTNMFDETSPLQLDDTEVADTLKRLEGDIYSITRVRMYVLLRLDSALSSGGASYDHPIITVEHVLPQHPADGSAWWSAFTDKQHDFWVHRLANLVLLTRRKNSEASNLDFETKKEKYFTTRTGTSPFALTSQVLATEEWTPAYLWHRQEALVAALRDLWRLH